MVTGAMARSRWIAVAVLSATFVAGAMLGAAATRLLASERAEERAAQPRTGDERRERGHRTSIFDQIGLTAEQKAAVDSVLEKRRLDTEAFWKEHGPELRAIMDSTRVEVDRVLTPEQQEQVKQFRERRGWNRGGRDGRDGPPPPNWAPGRRDDDTPRPEKDDSARRSISYHEPQYL